MRNKQCGGVKFRRQQAVYAYIVDFISFDKMLIIEIDGGQHNDPETIARDKQRTEYLEHEGYRILRFWNNDVLQNIEGVIFKITEYLEYPHLTSPVEGEGRG